MVPLQPIRQYRLGLIMQSNPEAAIDTRLSQLATISIVIAFILLTVLLLANRRRIQSKRTQSEFALPDAKKQRRASKDEDTDGAPAPPPP